eukprot:g3.t1
MGRCICRNFVRKQKPHRIAHMAVNRSVDDTVVDIASEKEEVDSDFKFQRTNDDDCWLDTLTKEDTLKHLAWEIVKDLRRTHGSSPYFRERSTQELMLRILLIYAMENKDIRYRQGMNELLAVVLVLLEREKMDAAAPSEVDGGEGDPLSERPAATVLPILLDRSEIESDAYALLSLILSRMTMVFQPRPTPSRKKKGKKSPSPTSSPTGETSQEDVRRASTTVGTPPRFGEEYRKSYLLRKIRYVHGTLLKGADSHLAKHMKALGVEPHLYMLRWMRLLFAREFPIHQLWLIWDAVFAISPEDFDFADYIAVAILSTSREAILEKDCLSELIPYLQRNTGHVSVSSSSSSSSQCPLDATDVVARALDIQRASLFSETTLSNSMDRRKRGDDCDRSGADSPAVGVAIDEIAAKTSWHPWLQQEKKKEEGDEERGTEYDKDDDGGDVLCAAGGSCSSPIVPRNDPTLLFTSAGMVPFKEVFLGREERPYDRATSAQRCLRAGGKHNDLDNVGFTPRHHTFFEMLGNFSFGSYFKEEAIFYAWRYLTEVLCLPKERLRVTVFETDEESRKLWKQIAGIPDSHIADRGTEDNFWSLGENDGPCGPCTEIFWDTDGTGLGGTMIGSEDDDDRWLEIWNLVFMQHVQSTDTNEQLKPLGRPAVDTGMGLERMASVVQNVSSNFETDNFRAVLGFLDAELSSRGGGMGTEDTDMARAASHVVVDHVRAAAFLIADGVFPSAVGRGYVLRRILRRAVRYGHAHLGAREPLLCSLVPAIIEAMGKAHASHLNQHRSTIEAILRNEETAFLGTLDRGLKLLDRHMNREISAETSSTVVPPELAFKLYDTFGFPVDLTDVIARERGWELNVSKVDSLMGDQRERARKAWKGSGERRMPNDVLEWQAAGVSTTFSGYDVNDATMTPPPQTCRVVAVAAGEGGANDFVAIDPCPFFGERGGQAGDVGELRLLDGSSRRFRVVGTECPFPDGYALRLARKEDASALVVGAKLEARVDRTHRTGCAAHHTATHMLNASLREVVGSPAEGAEGVTADPGHLPVQAGSNVQADSFTFDFTHNRALTRSELDRIEEQVNRVANLGLPVHARAMNMDDALSCGAVAHFEDRYIGDVVRVVSIEGQRDESAYSRELCCGTHATSTNAVSPFLILKERSVASGTRRIEAVAGAAASRWLVKQQKILRSTAAALGVEASQLPAFVARVTEQEKKLKDQVKTLRSLCSRLPNDYRAGAVFEYEPPSLSSTAVSSDEKTIVHVHSLDPEFAKDSALLRLRADAVRERTPEAFHLLLAGKRVLCSAPTKANEPALGARDLMKPIFGALNGKGGGSPDMAEGKFGKEVGIADIASVEGVLVVS